MAVDAFIWFNDPGVGKAPEGETTDSVYRKDTGTDATAKTNGAFEIKDFSFSIENPTTIGSGTMGAGAGKAKFNEFEITRTTDKSSPIFFKNCVSGVHYKTVTLAMRKAGAEAGKSGAEFLRYVFGVVFTTGIDWSGPGDEGPEEKIKFVFGALQVKYIIQKATGEQDLAAPPNIATWSQMNNTDQPDEPLPS
jgi:type VI secretion system secreted protein Hcp